MVAEFVKDALRGIRQIPEGRLISYRVDKSCRPRVEVPGLLTHYRWFARLFGCWVLREQAFAVELYQRLNYAGVAKLVRQLSCKQQIAGSSSVSGPKPKAIGFLSVAFVLASPFVRR